MESVWTDGLQGPVRKASRTVLLPLSHHMCSFLCLDRSPTPRPASPFHPWVSAWTALPQGSLPFPPNLRPPSTVYWVSEP